MKAPAFAYTRPRSLAEALDLLEHHRDSAKILAGGQSLMPALNMRLAAPQVLIDISRLKELAGIRMADNRLHIGALTTHAEIERSADIREHVPLLSAAARHIAHPAIRNAGTFGGSLAMADPAAEWPACCLALEAQIVLVSRNDTRQVAAGDFFRGPYSTEIRPDELLTEVVVPVPAAGMRHAFVELARRRGDYAIVGIAALAQTANGRINRLRLAFLGAGDKPLQAVRAAQSIVGNALSAHTLAAAQQALENDLTPSADLYHSAATKLHLARVLLARALAQLAAQ